MPKHTAADELSVGEVLARLREEKGMSLEDVNRVTMIPVAKLALLEANDFAAFDNQIFVSGYIRSYAKIVGGNGDVLVENFNNGGIVKVSEPPQDYASKSQNEAEKANASLPVGRRTEPKSEFSLNADPAVKANNVIDKPEAGSAKSMEPADAEPSISAPANTSLGPSDFPVKTGKRFSLIDIIANLRLSVVAIILVIIWVLASLLMGDEPLSSKPAQSEKNTAEAQVGTSRNGVNSGLPSADDKTFEEGEAEAAALSEVQTSDTIGVKNAGAIDANNAAVDDYEPQTLSLPASAVDGLSADDGLSSIGDSSSANDLSPTEQTASADTSPQLNPEVEAGASDISQVSDSIAAEPTDLSVGQGSQNLVFSFIEDCWIEVIDTKTQSKFADLKNKGDNLRLFGEGPFEVMLGNAHVVTLSVNGEPYTITPRGTRKTLRFTVDAAAQ